MTTAPIIPAAEIGAQGFTEARSGAKNIGNEREMQVEFFLRRREARSGAKNIGNEREMQVEFFLRRRQDLNKLKSVGANHRFGLLCQDVTNQQIRDKL